MTASNTENQQPDSTEKSVGDQVTQSGDESPENLPPKAWVTLVMFAGFVVLFGTCANFFLFD
ncbi:MAG: hypothetical protein ACTHZ9_08135 [Leucobacter sp.]